MGGRGSGAGRRVDCLGWERGFFHIGWLGRGEGNVWISWIGGGGVRVVST